MSPIKKTPRKLSETFILNIVLNTIKPVSYTHLDVYKRQIMENVDSIGGVVHLDAAPGRGTRVDLVWSKDVVA